MIKSVLTFAGAILIALIVAFTVPLSASGVTANSVKSAVSFSTAKIGSITINLNILLSILVTLQGFLFTIAAASLLVQTTWLIVSRSKAPLAIMDAALRNYPQTFSLLVKKPLAKSIAVVFLVFLPVVIDAVQHATVQALVVRGVATDLGVAHYKYINTSETKSQYSSYVVSKNGSVTALTPIASIAAANGISSVVNACSNQTRTCGTLATNLTTSLITCEGEVDCTPEIDSYNDYDIRCSSEEKLMVYPQIRHGWLNSSVVIDAFNISNGEYPVVDWVIRRADPAYTLFNGGSPAQTLVATVYCQITGAWVKRVESQSRGSLRRIVQRRYNSFAGAGEENTPIMDPLSNLSQSAAAIGYLRLALEGNLRGTCKGGLTSFEPFACTGSLNHLTWASDPSHVHHDTVLMEQEMRFTIEMLMKHLFVNVMPAINGSATCMACATRAAEWVVLSSAVAFFGSILGLVLVFSALSIYLEAIEGHEDESITAEKLLTAFGKLPVSGDTLIFLDQGGKVVMEDAPKEQPYLVSDLGPN
ncbi:hypothetical protein HDU77_006335 [Chytriomyces hyalinus]|nr:hypothetical protein HDU77_006335 [Chytriomyces hyalinus]